MFFLLKSIFWLSLVFYCMNWPGGERPETVARQAAGEAAAQAQETIARKATEACAANPAGCLAIAQKATARHAAAKSGLRSSMAD